MDLLLYVKEGEEFRVLKVPPYVVRDLLRDRLSKSELDRINRFAERTANPIIPGPGSVVVDFSKRTALGFQSGLNIPDLEPTWQVSEQI